MAPFKKQLRLNTHRRKERTMRGKCVKKAAILFCLAALLTSSMPIYAAENNSAVMEYSVSRVNPIYADAAIESDVVVSSEKQAAAVFSANRTYTTVEDAGAYLREQMVARATSIDISYQTKDDDWNALVDGIFAVALEYTGNPCEGDYLSFQWQGYECPISYMYDGSTYYATLSFSINYYTNAEQELAVSNKVDEVLVSLNLDGKTKYEKIKAIYDYICNNVSYDYTNLEDETYKLKYTAYAALIDKTSVCQGYANLLYRLLLEAGIDTRIISGESSGERHAWNIVEYGDVYYNVDATWDTNFTDAYQFFMKTNNEFTDHARDAEYLTEEFCTKYKMSEKTFSVLDPSYEENPFTDVDADDYFYAPVLWAYNRGITAGVDTGIFAPKASCTRAQVVSFLWRAENSPAPVGTSNPFVDVKANAYYADAVQWAYENQIAAGTSDTEFSPKATVTRAQFVSFLWRLAGCPEPAGTENPFTDVKSSEYYAKAVQWAYENQIAAGTSDTEFAPKASCTRAQVVSFLHRYYEK